MTIKVEIGGTEMEVELTYTQEKQILYQLQHEEDVADIGYALDGMLEDGYITESQCEYLRRRMDDLVESYRDRIDGDDETWYYMARDTVKEQMRKSECEMEIWREAHEEQAV